MWSVALLLVCLPRQVWRSVRACFGAPHVEAHLAAPTRPWWSVKNDMHIFNNVIRHLMESGALEEGTALLLDYRFVEAQLRQTDMQQVVQDYAWAADALREAQGAQGDRAVCLRLPAIEDIDSALRMARPTLSVRPQELAFQLSGRLHLLKKKNGSVAQLIESTKEHAPVSCILALSQCLPLPICGLQVSIPVSGVISAAILPEADRVVAVGVDALARVLDISRAEAVYELDGHAGRVNCVASYVVGAGAAIVSGGADGTLRFWDAKTGAATGCHINASDGEVRAVAASKDGLYVASVCSRGEVRRWSTRLREEAGILAAAVGEELRVVDAVAISADGRRVAAATRPRQVHVWGVDDDAAGVAAPAALLGAHDYGVLALAMTEGGCTVVSGGYDCTVRVWRVSDRTAVGDPIVTESDVESLSVIGNTKICVGLWGGSILLYDMRSHALLRQLPHAHSRWVCSIDASADGRRLASCGDDELVRVWSLERVRGRGGGWEGSAHQEPVSGVECVAASDDGRWVVSGHLDGGVWIWDVAKGEVDDELLAGNASNTVHCATFSPDNRRIVCGARDGSVRVWSIKSRLELFRPMLLHARCVNSIVVSPNGKRIVSGSHDRTVRVWCMRSGAPVFGPLEGHNGWVTAVAVSPDCRYIASGSWDGDVRVWDMSSGEVVGGPLAGHSSSVGHVEVSADSLHIVSWSMDEARVWCIATRECERILERGDPFFHSSTEVLTTSENCPSADQSARLCISRTSWSRLIYSGDPLNESVLGGFDSRVEPSAWHYDSKRKRLCAGLENGRMAILYMK